MKLTQKQIKNILLTAAEDETMSIGVLRTLIVFCFKPAKVTKKDIAWAYLKLREQGLLRSCYGMD
jgi:hypothetical protein